MNFKIANNQNKNTYYENGSLLYIRDMNHINYYLNKTDDKNLDSYYYKISEEDSEDLLIRVFRLSDDYEGFDYLFKPDKEIDYYKLESIKFSPKPDVS